MGRFVPLLLKGQHKRGKPQNLPLGFGLRSPQAELTSMEGDPLVRCLAAQDRLAIVEGALDSPEGDGSRKALLQERRKATV